MAGLRLQQSVQCNDFLLSPREMQGGEGFGTSYLPSPSRNFLFGSIMLNALLKAVAGALMLIGVMWLAMKSGLL